MVCLGNEIDSNEDEDLMQYQDTYVKARASPNIVNSINSKVL